MATLADNHDGSLHVEPLSDDSDSYSVPPSESEEEETSQLKDHGKKQSHEMTMCNADIEASITATLDLAFKEYRKAKTRFLLSLVHDDRTFNDAEKSARATCDIDILDDDELRETIVLKDLNCSLDSRSKDAKRAVKSGRRNNHSRPKVKHDQNCTSGIIKGSFLKEKENISENLEVRPRSRRMENNSNNVRTEMKRFSSKNCIVKKGVDQREDLIFSSDQSKDVLDHHWTFIPQLSPEQMTAERERRAKLRKMHRWERFQFRKTNEDESKLMSRFPIIPSFAYLEVRARQILNKRREMIADSRFKDESTRKVDYVDVPSDSRDGVQPEIPSVLQEPIKEPPSLEIPAKTVASVGSAPSSQLDLVDEVGSKEDITITQLDSEPKQDNEEGMKKGKTKKDKKKKKRRSSSSSEDLETLEKRSEARLGLRK